jgi:aspartyl protease family protein
MRRLAPLLLLLGLGLAAAQPSPPAPAQVQLNGTLGARAALLLIDGEARTVEVGATVKGVRLVALEDGRATIEIGGRRQTLTLGASPGRIVSPTTVPRQIILPMGPGGHYTSIGMINGQVTTFLVDTGATSVAISQIEAEKLGLRYLSGKRVVTQTANGTVPAYLIELASVRVGNVQVNHVEAIVIPGQMNYVLLGNSFLNRFQMRREHDVMTLELRY